MKRLKKLKPAFWDHHTITDSHAHSGLNFAHMWKLIVFFTSLMAILPLLVMICVEFNISRNIIEEEVKSSMSKIVKAAAASISHSTDKKKEDVQKSAFEYITHLYPGDGNDIFIVKDDSTLVTPSENFGKQGTSFILEHDSFNQKFGIIDDKTTFEGEFFIAYAKIENSSLYVVLAHSKKLFKDLWLKPRLNLVGYLIVSIIIIVLAIMGTATYLVGRIHRADSKRSEALHHAEYANKLASIGRLASGVAHEINNPLAIINQKTGLITDLFAMSEDHSSDERLIQLANDIMDAVTRCGSITRQLLDFARDMELKIQPLDLQEVIDQVLIFLGKEAERKSITISMDYPKPISGFECDRGSLQQIFLNLFNNALAAMEDGGKLDISIRPKNDDSVLIRVSDNGCGISNQNIIKVFEPFFTSKDDHFSTGMGLSITYGLVQEIGGDIRVKSQVGEGTCFTLTLPLKAREE